MFKTPALLHTDPAGKPAEDVGIFLIERLLTNVLTAHQHIQEKLRGSQKESEEGRLSVIGLDLLMKALKEEYKNDEVDFEKIEENKSYKITNTKTNFYTVKSIKVKFKNCLTVSYNFRYWVDENGKENFIKDIYSVDTSLLSRNKMIEALKNI